MTGQRFQTLLGRMGREGRREVDSSHDLGRCRELSGNVIGLQTIAFYPLKEVS